jgi:hypothetical protein
MLRSGMFLPHVALGLDDTNSGWAEAMAEAEWESEDTEKSLYAMSEF